METFLPVAFDNLSSYDGPKVKKGLKEVEGLLARLIVIQRAALGNARDTWKGEISGIYSVISFVQHRPSAGGPGVETGPSRTGTSFSTRAPMDSLVSGSSLYWLINHSNMHFQPDILLQLQEEASYWVTQ